MCARVCVMHPYLYKGIDGEAHHSANSNFLHGSECTGLCVNTVRHGSIPNKRTLLLALQGQRVFVNRVLLLNSVLRRSGPHAFQAPQDVVCIVGKSSRPRGRQGCKPHINLPYFPATLAEEYTWLTTNSCYHLS